MNDNRFSCIFDKDTMKDALEAFNKRKIINIISYETDGVLLEHKGIKRKFTYPEKMNSEWFRKLFYISPDLPFKINSLDLIRFIFQKIEKRHFMTCRKIYLIYNEKDVEMLNAESGRQVISIPTFYFGDQSHMFNKESTIVINLRRILQLTQADYSNGYIGASIHEFAEKFTSSIISCIITEGKKLYEETNFLYFSGKEHSNCKFKYQWSYVSFHNCPYDIELADVLYCFFVRRMKKQSKHWQIESDDNMQNFHLSRNGVEIADYEDGTLRIAEDCKDEYQIKEIFNFFDIYNITKVE